MAKKRTKKRAAEPAELVSVELYRNEWQEAARVASLKARRLVSDGLRNSGDWWVAFAAWLGSEVAERYDKATASAALTMKESTQEQLVAACVTAGVDWLVYRITCGTRRVKMKSGDPPAIRAAAAQLRNLIEQGEIEE